MTREKFMAELRALIVARHTWASDTEKLERFMLAVLRTLRGDDGGPYYDHNGDATKDAWRAIGGKGRPTLKALRALPEA